MPDLMIGVREFTDGAMREVYLGPDGRRYVHKGGRRVHGVWLPPDQEPPEPVVVSTPPPRECAP
jgi:hypothetical protein